MENLDDSAASGAFSASAGQVLRQHAEEIVRGKAAPLPEDLQALSPEAMRRQLHELQVHRIELEMQNEELRRTQLELDTSRARYFDLYDLAPVGYCTVSEQGLFLEANLTAATPLGLTRSELVKRPISRFIFKADQDIYYSCRQQLLASGQAQSCELRMVKNTDLRFWVHLTVTAAHGENGAPVLRIVLSDMTERRLAQDALQASLLEKEALLKEVHHRVKNNLQVIASLLRLEGGRSAHTATQAVLGDMQGRIRAMALLHESLYRSGIFASVDLGAYLKQLANQSFRALVVSPGAVQLELELASVRVSMDQAAPCGLFVNELLSNSLKHGFPDGRPGTVRIELQPVESGPPGQWRLCVSDNGAGLPADFEIRRQNSLGLQLVSDLAMQIGGALQTGSGPSASFTATFRVSEPAAREKPDNRGDQTA